MQFDFHPRANVRGRTVLTAPACSRAGWKLTCHLCGMETETGSCVETGLEKVVSVEKPPCKSWWTLPWLKGRWRTSASVVSGVFLTMPSVLVTQYLRLARLADRRLAEGPFAMSTVILSAPETIAA